MCLDILAAGEECVSWGTTPGLRVVSHGCSQQRTANTFVLLRTLLAHLPRQGVTMANRRGWILGGLGGWIAGVMLCGGFAYAAIPNSTTGKISACYNSTNGQLRVIDRQAGATCKNPEKLLEWNSEGAPGTPGAPGAAGA